MKHTKIFVVLNEETLSIMKGKHNKVAKFPTEEAADLAASYKLNMWKVVEVNFKHEFLHHTL